MLVSIKDKKYIFKPIEHNYPTRNNRLFGYVVPKLDSRASSDDSFYLAYLEYRNIPHTKLRFGSCPCIRSALTDGSNWIGHRNLNGPKIP